MMVHGDGLVYCVRRYPNIYKHAIPRLRVAYSIDEVRESDGHYVCQAAFWFRTQAAATRRMTELIAEDTHAAPEGGAR